MNSVERHEARYQRRKAKRYQKRFERVMDVINSDPFSYHNLYYWGKKCCKGVRWKNSVQRFEMHLLSNTAHNKKLIDNDSWVSHPYQRFILSERGKLRVIDAPLIKDRQIHKVATQDILIPLYTPNMIYNNCASLKNKGLRESSNLLKRDLRRHFKKYGLKGNIILLDFHQFFPTAPRDKVYKQHDKYIIYEKYKNLLSTIVETMPEGLPLGVETSQAEMISLPSPLDNYIKCQLSISGAGHYMDDYYIIVPPYLDVNDIYNKIVNYANNFGFTINEKKSKILPIYKSFRYCKVKYQLTDTGRVITHGCKDNIYRDTKKIKSLYVKIQNKELTYKDLYCSLNGMIAYYLPYDDHGRILKIRRLFYSLFGFSCESIDHFKFMDALVCNNGGKLYV